jgi:hypothetical protein
MHDPKMEGRLRITFDAGRLAMVEVLVDGEPVAWLPVTALSESARAHTPGLVQIELHSQRVETVRI